MPLTLGLRKGHDFFVGKEMTRVTLKEIEGPYKFTLSIKGQEFHIGDDCSQEILPSVRVSSGLRGSAEVARVIIDAPQEIRIFRGNVARQKRKTHEVQVHRKSSTTGITIDVIHTECPVVRNDIPRRDNYAP